MVVRLFVADPNTMVRLGYATALTGHDDMVLVGEAGTVAEARELIAATRPDVVVVNHSLLAAEPRPAEPRPAGGVTSAGRTTVVSAGGVTSAGRTTVVSAANVTPTGRTSAGWLALGRQIRADRPEVGLVLVGPADDDLLFLALEERFSAYLPRSAAVDVILSAVRHAAVAPTAFTAPDLATSLARRRAAGAVLSPRELEVLRHVYRGANNARIASSMRLTESTVRTYLARVYDKLGVRTRAEALVTAVERGLIR
jgi:DNA-binding NarL/FixJ family response regulator